MVQFVQQFAMDSIYLLYLLYVSYQWYTNAQLQRKKKETNARKYNSEDLSMLYMRGLQTGWRTRHGS